MTRPPTEAASPLLALVLKVVPVTLENAQIGLEHVQRLLSAEGVRTYRIKMEHALPLAGNDLIGLPHVLFCRNDFVVCGHWRMPMAHHPTISLVQKRPLSNSEGASA